MVGNTWEGTADWYRATAYADADSRNTGGPESGDLRVLRGGSSMYDDRFSTTTARMVQPPEVDNWTSWTFAPNASW